MAELAAPSERRSPARSSRWYWICLASVLLLVFLRGAAWQGVFRPVRIVGGSMAESLQGPRFSLRCEDCGFEFCCGVEFPPDDDLAVCPNCGYARNRVHSASRLPGQRVLIDRWGYWCRAPQVWQTVAFPPPIDSGTLAVKRLVAGGGGRLAIRDGDIFVDDQIQRKTLDQLRHLRVVVHNDHFRPTRDPTLPSRWRAASPDSRWRSTPSGYAWDAPPTATEHDVQWLEYVQWVCWPNASPRVTRPTPSLIFDHDAYNQSLSRGALNRVTDVLLECGIMLQGTGRVILKTNTGADDFQLELTHPATSCRLIHNGEIAWQVRDHRQRLPWIVELAVCDQQVLASINGVSLPSFVFQPAVARQVDETFVPLAIGATGGRVQLEPPCIYRDLYYLGPGGQRRWERPEPLGPGQWFALGDNVPISIDSRHGGAIDRHAIIGPVIKLSW